MSCVSHGRGNSFTGKRAVIDTVSEKHRKGELLLYIHLGERISIHDSTVIGVFDIENTTIGPDTRAYLNRMEAEGRVVNVSEEMPKSFVVCMEPEGEKAYISPISAATLRKRAKTMF